MADVAPAEFLQQLKTTYPQPASLQGAKAIIYNPWYVAAAVGYTASNRPEAVPLVFLQVLGDLKNAQAVQGVDATEAHKEQLLLARRTREGILKGGVLSGASRVWRFLRSLHVASR